ncbi:hypothetical protein CC86DRAFT_394587 [Ophiobolus disseminans]|uniref:Uncharacterized protein n=1 Tax=Ophiobolus disseminans TaxID=1469910 RepID=A0A6A6ZZ25_9PLEO|nr:hypothetical protein CC86DRAFT_394587 [Ophiobolus disseminans]
MLVNIAILSLPLLATSARHGHNHARGHKQVLEQRSAEANIVAVTDTVTVTVTVTAAPASSSAAQSSTTIVTTKETLPAEKNTNGGEQGFQDLQPVANSATIKNSCPYSVYISSVGDPSCEGDAAEGKLVEANGTYTETFRKCVNGGVSLKVSKTEDASRPMQFEYALWKDKPDTVSYDISYLDCMKNQNGEKDLSECAGHDGGIQAMGGGSDTPTYRCPANIWCDKKAYVVAEFAYQPGAPVGSCKAEKGIAFELCGGSA